MQTTYIPYADETNSLEAFVAYPSKEKRPAVLLCHGWKGRDDFICEKAQAIAHLGYVGFALDMYGKGVLGKSKEENAALKKPFFEDRYLLQKRALKGFEILSSLPYVDTKQIVVLGFGFGGLCALDLARSGTALKGAISVYGHFDPLPPSLKKAIQAKILILHGYNDPISPQDALLPFQKELSEAKVDWQTHIFSNTMHAFTTPQANDPSSGNLYNPLSAERAWVAISHFLGEVFICQRTGDAF